MPRKRTCKIPPPPPRKELSDNPVKICSEISRLFHGKLREERCIDGVLSQPGARLVLAVLALNETSPRFCQGSSFILNTFIPYCVHNDSNLSVLIPQDFS